MKCIVLFNGGFHSSLSLAIATRAYGASNVLALNIRQKLTDEVRDNVCKALEVEYRQYYADQLLWGLSDVNPGGLVLTLGAMYAAKYIKDDSPIVIAGHADRPHDQGWITYMESAFRTMYGKYGLVVNTPFINMDIPNMAICIRGLYSVSPYTLKSVLDWETSCARRCGACKHCSYRALVLEQAGMKDAS